MVRVMACGVVVVAVLCGGCVHDGVSPEPTPNDTTPVTTDEAALVDACEKAVAEPLATNFGAPLPGLSPALVARFEAGKEAFETIETLAEGLGPVFNEASCVACHLQGGTGGAGSVVETRFGKRNADGTFDPLAEFGGSLIQVQGITNGSCSQPGEQVPAAANVVAGRQTTPLFGLGLLDAVPSWLLRQLADPRDRDHDGISGRLNIVVSPATQRSEIGRFGWKAQVPSVFVFSGDAYLNEMGITNNLFPVENAPQGGPIVCDDGIPGPGVDDEDANNNGISDGIEAFSDFMRLLAPPPLASAPTAEVLRGARTFAVLQCASCHQPLLITGSVPDVAALSRKRFFPFTDLLLHDMGALGDGIVQGRAEGREMRTAPLWGLRVSAPYLHDGRAATIGAAIAAHDGEAARARDAFLALPAARRAALLAFLNFI